MNLNLADEAALARIPGLGPVRAEAIVRFRVGHRFQAVEELTKIRGIGPKTLSRIRPWLTLEVKPVGT